MASESSCGKQRGVASRPVGREDGINSLFRETRSWFRLAEFLHCQTFVSPDISVETKVFLLSVAVATGYEREIPALRPRKEVDC